MLLVSTTNAGCDHDPGCPLLGSVGNCLPNNYPSPTCLRVQPPLVPSPKPHSDSPLLHFVTSPCQILPTNDGNFRRCCICAGTWRLLAGCSDAVRLVSPMGRLGRHRRSPGTRTQRGNNSYRWPSPRTMVSLVPNDARYRRVLGACISQIHQRLGTRKMAGI